MTALSRQDAFPLLPAALALAGASLLGLSGLYLAAAWLASPDAGRAVLLTGGVVSLAALLGLGPVALLGPAGVMPTAAGHFAGAVVRFIAGLAALVLGLGQLHLPAAGLVLGLTIYLPLLLIETALVGRYLWRKDFAGKELA